MPNCLVIAEIGINHQGEMDKAFQMIQEAKVAGADIIKTQVYEPEKLLNKKQFSKEDWAIIKRTKLDYDQVKKMKQWSDDIGIEFMASAFDTKQLGWLEDLNVKRHKIASRSIYDVDYVNAVKATGKEHFISMGWLLEDNKLEESYYKTWCRLQEGVKARILYCVSKYPTSLEEIKLEYLVEMGYCFDVNISDTYYGFSDHTIGLTAAMAAIVYGARVIEKHFTLSKSLPGPDHVGSMDFAELKTLCKFRDEFERMGN